MHGPPDAIKGFVNARWRSGNHRVAPPHAILYTGCRATWETLGAPGAFVAHVLAARCTRPARWVVCVANEGPVHIAAELKPYAVVAVKADAPAEAAVRVAALRLRCGVLVVREQNGVGRSVLDGAQWPAPRLPTNDTDTVVPPGYDSRPKIEALMTAVGGDMQRVTARAQMEVAPCAGVVREVERIHLGLADKEAQWRKLLDATLVERERPKVQAKSSFFLNMLQD